MTCLALPSVRNSLVVPLVTLTLALVAGCGGPRTDRISYADIRTTTTAALLPKEIALMYLQRIKSEKTSRTGEPVIPGCLLTETGAWSGGAYEKRNVTLGTTISPMDIPTYNRWILFKIEDRRGTDLTQAELERPHDWIYSIRSPRNARSLLNTVDHCVLGPSTEPPRKVIEALLSLGVEVAADFAYIVPKK